MIFYSKTNKVLCEAIQYRKEAILLEKIVDTVYIVTVYCERHTTNSNYQAVNFYIIMKFIIILNRAIFICYTLMYQQNCT